MGNKRIVVTGANGYLGSAFISHLIDFGYQPIGILKKGSKWDLPIDIETVSGEPGDEKLISEIIGDADTIYHLAGLKDPVQCSKKVNQAIESNIILTQKIIKLARKKRAKIIFASTYWVYGHMAPLPFHENISIMPSEAYGWSKALAEKIVMLSGLDFTILRLTNIFGYGTGRKYEEVISLFLKKAMAGDTILLKNCGKHSMDFIYIDDVCNVMLNLKNINSKKPVLNIGGGAPVTISKLAEVINKVSKRLTGNTAVIKKGEKENDEIIFSDKYLDISTLRQLTSFNPKPLEKALEEFANKILAEDGL